MNGKFRAYFDPRILYLFSLITITLAVIMHLNFDETSIIMLLLIAGIAPGNIAYICNNFKERAKLAHFLQNYRQLLNRGVWKFGGFAFRF